MSSTPPVLSTTSNVQTSPIKPIDLKPLLSEIVTNIINRNESVETNKPAIKQSLEKHLPLFDKNKVATDLQQSEWRSNVELPLRQNINELFKNDHMKYEKIEQLIELVIYIYELGYVDATYLLYIFEDMFESRSIRDSIELFSIMEQRVEFFSQDAFVGSGRAKKQLLKLCNDLLRRLSKSTNPEPCGRILIFMSYLIPMFDPSGINSKSINNDEHSLSIELLLKDQQDSSSFDNNNNNDTSTGTTVDLNFYKQFWSLQSYFHNPYQLISNVPATGFVIAGNASVTINKERWNHFTQAVELVLTTFATHINLDELEALPKSHYFTKYLTGSNLMKLQLKDAIFRRNILTQLLFTFQFLEITIQKNPSLFSDENKQTIQNQTLRAFKIISQTQPNGTHFAECLSSILKRETNWISWKRDNGCKSFEKSSCQPIVIKKRKVKKTDSSKVSMGNAELSRLWNLSNDNHEFLKQDLKLSLDTYLAPLKKELEQLEEETRLKAEKEERLKVKEAKRREDRLKREEELAEKKRKNPDYVPTEEDEEPDIIDSDELEDLDEPQPLLKDDQMYIWKTMRLMSRRKIDCFKASDNKLKIDEIVQAYYSKKPQSPSKIK